MQKAAKLLVLLILLFPVFSFLRGGMPEKEAEIRKLYNGRNYKEAALLAEKTLRSLKDSPEDPLAGTIYSLGRASWQSLGRIQEKSELQDLVMELFPGNLSILEHLSIEDPFGYILDGKVVRGYPRGFHAGNVDLQEYDRIRLLRHILGSKKKFDASESAVKGRYYAVLARFLYRDRFQSWKLALLTPLDRPPRAEDGEKPSYSYSPPPADEKGEPVLYKIPVSFEEARNDGERLRYCWEMMRKAPAATHVHRQGIRDFAAFLHGEFDFEFLDESIREEYRTSEEKLLLLHSLKENETICRLSSGVKKIILPEEFNYIRMFREIGSDETLARIYSSRLQLEKALEHWKKALKKDPRSKSIAQEIRNITGNWGMILPFPMGVEGTAPELKLIYRNATGAVVTIRELDAHLLAELILERRDDPEAKVPRSALELMTYGYYRNGKRYFLREESPWKELLAAAKTVESFPLVLSPRKGHWNTARKVPLPKAAKAGLYLVEVKFQDGSECGSLLCVSKGMFFVRHLAGGGGRALFCDAKTGEALPGKKFALYSCRHSYARSSSEAKKFGGRRSRIETKKMEFVTDKDGTFLIPEQARDTRENLFVSLEKDHFVFLPLWAMFGSSPAGKSAERERLFFITDRPVYKPGDRVRFTVYARTPSYEKSLRPDGTAGKERKYPVFVTDARGKEIFRKEFHPDRNSSFSCAFELSKEASLGTYRIFAQGGTIAFRVEEYKKPEYELSIQTGKGVVKSGEEIEFLLQGKYFSGAPMAGAKISYRIFRREKMFFFPHPMPFDFLYGKGYFFCCRRWMPPFFFPQWGNSGEELVKEGELLCDDRGKCTVKVEKRFTERFAGKDSLYTIRAEVFDDSRAVVSASKSVTVSSVPFHVILRTSRGFYSPGEVVVPRVSAFTPDGKKVEDGFVILSLYERTFGASLVPEKGKLLKQEKYPLGEEKKFAFSTGKSASFLLEAEVVTKEGKSSASVPVLVRGMEEEKKTDPLFTELPFEVIRDKSTYAPGDTAKLLLLSRRENIPVYLFFRPCREDGMKKVHLRGKSLVVEMKITEKDYPNTFFEALCVQDGKVCKERVELPVPPRKKSLVLSLLPAGKECAPGEKLPLKIVLKDADGKGVEGVFTLAVYDRALEEISPNNVQSIFPFFWSWKRYFSGMLYSFADLRTPVHKGADIPGLPGVYTLWFLPEKSASGFGMEKKAFPRSSFRGRADFSKGMNGVMAMRKNEAPRMEEKASAAMALPGGAQGPEQTLPVRKDFADSILWIGCRETGKDGSAEVTIPVPDNLTSWRIRAWGLTRDNHVGEGVSEFAVNRKLMARLTLPEFLVRGDASSAVAHFHNLTDKPMQITCSLECASPAVLLKDVPGGKKELFLSLPPGGYASVNIPCLAMREGEGKFLLKARDAESGHADALLLSLPVFVKGAPKTVHYVGSLEKGTGPRTKVTEYAIPAERKENASFLTVRLSPSVAASAMRLLPFLAAENSKNSFGIISRFVPAFAAKKALDELKTDFDSLSLSPGKLDPLWREYIQKNDVPVYTNALFRKNLAEGEKMLRLMRNSDGGWGWFSSHYERSFPDTTAEVVDALLLVKGKESVSGDADLREGLLWLKRHAESRLALLKKEKSAPEETDALVLKVLAAGGIVLPALEKKLFEKRKHFSPCALAMFGLALQKGSPMRKEVLRNLTNYLVRNEEAGTAYLQIPESFFRFWTGDENSANASYLLLLLDEDPGNPLCGAIARYLAVNVQHSPWRNSTRSLGKVLQALSSYIVKNKEAETMLSVTLSLDGAVWKTVRIDRKNLWKEIAFSIDENSPEGKKFLSPGMHRLKISCEGTGALLYTSSVSFFTLEEKIAPAGREMKIVRNYYKRTREKRADAMVDGTGSPVAVEKESFVRRKLVPGEKLSPGDIVEVELITESFNDHDYVVLSDPLPAGFEYVRPVSGYDWKGFAPVYREYRKREARFYLRNLPRGKGNLTYLLRAQLPGCYTALPASGKGVYAPLLSCNSSSLVWAIEGKGD